MNQKELKEIYKEELRKAWADEKMVNYCSKSTAYIVEHNGELYGIEKPRIETSFCFGYGQNGITTEEEEQNAFAMERKAEQDKEYFIEENLADIKRQIASLKEILEDMNLNWADGSHPHYMVETGKKYCGQDEDCKLRYFGIVDTFRTVRGTLCYDKELIEKFIKAYEEVQKDFTKRLYTYLKRYGMSKVRTWSYLAD